MSNPPWLHNHLEWVEVSVVFPQESNVPTVFIGTAQFSGEMRSGPNLSPFSHQIDSYHSTDHIRLELVEHPYANGFSVFEKAMQHLRFTQRLVGTQWGEGELLLVFSDTLRYIPREIRTVPTDIKKVYLPTSKGNVSALTMWIFDIPITKMRQEEYRLNWPTKKY